MSPELFDSEVQDCRPTKFSDCYALAMVVYEVLSLRQPFHQYRNLVITGRIIQGDRPGRPDGVDGAWFTNDVWELLKRCWVPEPRNRPSVKDVLRCLEESSASWTSSRQLPAIHLVAGSFTGQSSDRSTTSSTDTIGVTSSSLTAVSQSAEKLDIQNLASAVNKVCRARLLFELRYRLDLS